ncbi:PhzF family phenazine biosynthesis protein [Streptomyces sp. NPDC002917]|uniref:PhzF family phenazine biosynthesis protein n=1 Tax=Streptomyces sp. NPDC002917 TaxID=3364671 RepID=UPI00368977C8
MSGPTQVNGTQNNTFVQQYAPVPTALDAAPLRPDGDPVLSLPFDLADVFTDTFLGGNQLAVFAETDSPLDSELMQALALEMNLSETVLGRGPPVPVELDVDDLAGRRTAEHDRLLTPA